MKSLLAARERPFPFSHNLYDVVDLCRESSITLPDFTDDLCMLTPFATRFRYSALPVDNADPLDRAGLLRSVTELRDFVHHELRL